MTEKEPQSFRLYLEALQEVENLLPLIKDARQMRALSELIRQYNEFPDQRSVHAVETVDFDPDHGIPMAFFLNGNKVEISRVIAYVGDPRQIKLGERSPGRPRFGCYVSDTEWGVCKLIAAPHKNPDGLENREQIDWELIAAEPIRDALSLWASGRFDAGKAGQPAAKGEEEKVRQRAKESAKLTPGKELNTRAYDAIYEVESRLRLFVWRLLSAKYEPTNGSKWWKGVFPKSVTENITKNAEKVQGFLWIEMPEDAPLAYTTLGDLRTLIDERRADFSSALSPLDVLLSEIVKIEAIRNHVAHNRAITEKLWETLVNAINLVLLGLERARTRP